MLYLNDYGRCDILIGNEEMDAIIEEAADHLCSMPIDSQVFVTSSDLDFLTFMMDELSDYGIDDLVMITPQDILKGHLRGKIGILLMPDLRFLSDRERAIIMQEAEILRTSHV